jgi:hypothetical protein
MERPEFVPDWELLVLANQLQRGQIFVRVPLNLRLA